MNANKTMIKTPAEVTEQEKAFFAEGFYAAANDVMTDEECRHLRNESDSMAPWGAPWLWCDAEEWIPAHDDWFTAGQEFFNRNINEIRDMIRKEIALLDEREDF